MFSQSTVTFTSVLLGVTVWGLTVFRNLGAGFRLTVEKNTKADIVEAPSPARI